MSSLRSLCSARNLAGAAIGAMLAALAAVGCEFFVTGNLPDVIKCTPGGGSSHDLCPPDRSWCDTAMHECVVPPDVGVGPDTGLDSDGAMAEASPGQDATLDGGVTGDADADAAEAGDGQVACVGFGCKCSRTANCSAGFTCADKQAVTSEIWNAALDAGVGGSAEGGAWGICVEPCCTSSDCDVGDGGSGSCVCFATGGGGNYCFPAGWLGDRSTVGTTSVVGGQGCGGDAAACRSGLCLDSGVCADTCCSNTSMTACAPGSVCQFGAFPGNGFDQHEAAHCAVPSNLGGPPPSTGGTGCMIDSDCRSNLCWRDAGEFRNKGPTCRDACRNPDECLGMSTRMSPQGTCSYLPYFLPASGDLVATCVPLPQQGGGGVRGDAGGGAACANTNDCQRGYCAGGLCLAVCFTGAVDCLSNERCRPQPLLMGGTAYSVLGCGM